MVWLFVESVGSGRSTGTGTAAIVETAAGGGASLWITSKSAEGSSKDFMDAEKKFPSVITRISAACRDTVYDFVMGP